ncbi:MAG: uL15 family ribosomal protein [Candidatus Bathyarchaeia archaeon]
MPHRLRKVRKMRGSRTHGYGRVGQHRKSGSKGMRRHSFDKGGWTYIVKYDPDYFGKKGFTSPKSKGIKLRTINLDGLEDLFDKLSSEGKLVTKEGRAFLDLENLGYDKLLGKGRVSKPYLIKVPSFSRLAVKKVEEVGGEIVGREELPQ